MTAKYSGKMLGDYPELLKKLHPSENAATRELMPIERTTSLKWQCLDNKDHTWSASISAVLKSKGCSHCAREKREEENNLAVKYPKVAELFDGENPVNAGFSPSKIFVKRDPTRSYSWKCLADPLHVWEGTVSSVVHNLSTDSKIACIVCRLEDLTVFSSLAVVYPDLALQFDSVLNETTADLVSAASTVKYFWHCDKAEDHVWRAFLKRRVQSGTSCLFCEKLFASSTSNLLLDFPAFAKEFCDGNNLDENGKPIDPATISVKTIQKYWWLCANKHKWQAEVSRRVKLKYGCRECWDKRVGVPAADFKAHDLESKSLSKVSKPGVISVAGKFLKDYPDLLFQLHSDEDPIIAAEFRAGSKTKVKWQCSFSKDHSWSVAIRERIRGYNCPYCANTLVSPEASIAVLCPKAAKLLDLDHPENKGITASEVGAGSAKKYFWRCFVASDHAWKAPARDVVRLAEKETCCIFCLGKRPCSTTSLAALYPKSAAQFHPTLNGVITPDQILATSGTKYFWQCSKSKDHIWKSSVRGKVSTTFDCMFCEGRLASTTINLVVSFPEIAKEFHPTKNIDKAGALIDPTTISKGSGYKYYWLCENGHEWQAVVRDRTNYDNGCAKCSGRLPTPERNLLVDCPEVAKEFALDLNDKKPTEYTVGSNARVWWRCSVKDCSYEWKTVISARTSKRNTGCPQCSLGQRSKPEIYLAYELALVLPVDLKIRKVRADGKLREADILIEDFKLIMEYDGAFHHRGKEEHDRKKNAALKKAGYTVMRVREKELGYLNKHLDILVDDKEDYFTRTCKVLKKLFTIRPDIKTNGKVSSKAAKYILRGKAQNTALADKLIKEEREKRAAARAKNKEKNANLREKRIREGKNSYASR